MMHQKYSHERLVAKQGSSFLARQRQALYKNPVPLNTAIASTLASATSPRYIVYMCVCVCTCVVNVCAYMCGRTFVVNVWAYMCGVCMRV